MMKGRVGEKLRKCDSQDEGMPDMRAKKKIERKENLVEAAL